MVSLGLEYVTEAGCQGGGSRNSSCHDPAASELTFVLYKN